MEMENTEQNKHLEDVSTTTKLKRNPLNQKGNFALIIGVVAVVLIAIFGVYKLRTNSVKTEDLNRPSNQQSQSLTPPTIINKDLFTGLKRPKIEQQGQKLVFTDGGLYGYQMDFTGIPEATITNADGPGYPFPTFEFDMYKLKPPQNKSMGGSVARFTFSVPMENPENLTLEDFAKQELEYKEGRTEGGYGGPSIISKITPTTLGTKKGVTWDTQQESKVFFSKHYLLEQNGKLIYSTMYSWNEPDFQRALVQYNKVVSSLEMTKTPIKIDKDVFYLWTKQKPNDVLAQYSPHGDIGESVPTIGSGWQPNTELEVKITEASNDAFNTVDGKLKTDDKGHFEGHFTIPQRFANADVPFLRVQVSNPNGQPSSQYIQKAEVILYFLDNIH
ncbi:hypothetical protein KKE78_03190 [Patescibacteria group bacterium]|nr:hypothetical protein [Patescibacteria group bacterium]